MEAESDGLSDVYISRACARNDADSRESTRSINGWRQLPDRYPLLDATWSTRRSWEALCLALVACFGLNEAMVYW